MKIVLNEHTVCDSLEDAKKLARKIDSRSTVSMFGPNGSLVELDYNKDTDNWEPHEDVEIS